MFSKTTEYALRAAVYLAARAGRTATSQEIARVTKVPVRYLSKVLQQLAACDVLTSQRGPSGGFALAGTAEQTSMLDVVQAVEPIARITECPLALAEHANCLCPLHQELDDLAAEVSRRLDAISLATLVRAPVVPLGIPGGAVGAEGYPFPADAEAEGE